MKIILKVGTAEYVLANGPERGLGNHVGPGDDFGHNSAVASQQGSLLRGAAMTPYLRHNASTALAFTVNVGFADLVTAQNYALNYPGSVPRNGKLRIVNDVSNVREIAAAVITAIDCRQLGVNVQISYQIIGGAVGNAT